MYSSKGQWYLVATAVIISLLAAVYYTVVKQESGEIISFTTEESFLEKMEILTTQLLFDNFTEERSKMIKNMVKSYDACKIFSRSRGMDCEMFCFCVYENSTKNTVSMSFFNETVNFTIASGTNVSNTLSKFEIGEYSIQVQNSTTLYLDLGFGAMCAKHEYRTSFCSCIILISDSENNFIGKTLNLNWC